MPFPERLGDVAAAHRRHFVVSEQRQVSAFAPELYLVVEVVDDLEPEEAGIELLGATEIPDLDADVIKPLKPQPYPLRQHRPRTQRPGRRGRRAEHTAPRW